MQTEEVEQVRSERKSRPKGHASNPQLSRYDQRLLNAKNNTFPVRFVLDWEASFADENCEVTGTIVEVDKFDILIRIDPQPLSGEDRCIWLKKSHIVSTEVMV